MDGEVKKSNNIIIDLSRIGLPDQKCIGVIERRAKKLGSNRRVILITKKHEIIKLF